MLVDWSRVHELRAEIGDDGFAEVVTMFLDESDAAVAQAANGLTPEALHFLKGAALNLGFADLAAACNESADPRRLAALYADSKASLLAETG